MTKKSSRSRTVENAIRDIIVEAVAEELLENPEIQMMITRSREDPKFRKKVLDALTKH
jgi:hypothetical protein